MPKELIDANTPLQQLIKSAYNDYQQDESENLYTVEFNPLESYKVGSAEKEGYEEIEIYKPYIDGLNAILTSNGYAPVRMQAADVHKLDKSKSSDDLNMYNEGYDYAKEVMETNPLFKTGVPSVAREGAIESWADTQYGLKKSVLKHLSAYDLDDRTANQIDDLTRYLFESMEPNMITHANKLYDEFENSQRPSMFQSLIGSGAEMVANLGEGANVKLRGMFPELEEAFDIKSLEDYANNLPESTGYGKMSFEELIDSEEYGQGVKTLFRNIITSIPQQIPSALTTIPVIRGVGFGLKAASAVGSGLAVGNVMETGAFSRNIQDRYRRLQSQAIRDRDVLMNPDSPDYNPDAFRDAYYIQIDELQGKDIDKMSDEEIRAVSDNISNLYAQLSTGVETLSSIAEGTLAAYTKGFSRFLTGNTKNLGGTVFNKMYKHPFLMRYGTAGTMEGMTEVGQALIEEYMTAKAIPSHKVNFTWQNGLENFAGGFVFGMGFEGIADLISKGPSIRRKNFNAPIDLSEKESNMIRQTSTPGFGSVKFDNDLIVVRLADGSNKYKLIADKHDVSVEDVIVREMELSDSESGFILDNKNVARMVLKRDPSILERYGLNPNALAPVKKEEKKIVVDPNQQDGDLPSEGVFRESQAFDDRDIPKGDTTVQQEQSGVVDEQRYDDSGLGLFNDSPFDDGSISAYSGQGLYDDTGIGLSIEQQEINRLEARIKELKKKTDVNDISGSERRAEIADLESRVLEFKKLAGNPAQRKKKKQKQVIEKQKQVNPEAKDIIGQSVTIQTPVLQGTKGKVIGTRADQGRPNIAVVDIGNKTREIKISNLSFSDKSEPVINTQKKLAKKKETPTNKIDSRTTSPLNAFFIDSQDISTPDLTEQEIQRVAKETRGIEETSEQAEARARKEVNKKVKSPKVLGEPNHRLQSKKLDELISNNIVTDEKSLEDWYDKKTRKEIIENADLTPERKQKALNNLDSILDKYKELLAKRNDDSKFEFAGKQLSQAIVNAIEGMTIGTDSGDSEFLRITWTNINGIEEYDIMYEHDATYKKYVQMAEDIMSKVPKDEFGPKHEAIADYVNESLAWKFMSEWFVKLDAVQPGLALGFEIKKEIIDKGFKIWKNNHPYGKEAQAYLNKIKRNKKIDDQANADFREQEIQKRISEEVAGTEGAFSREDLEPKVREEFEKEFPSKESIGTDPDGLDLEDAVQQGTATQLDEDFFKNFVSEIDQDAEADDVDIDLEPDQAMSMAEGFAGDFFDDLNQEAEKGNISVDDITVIPKEKGVPQQLLTGNLKRKFDRKANFLWNYAKSSTGLTDNQFADFLEIMYGYFDGTPLGENFRQWGEAKLNSSKFKQFLDKTLGKNKDLTGANFVEEKLLNVDFQDTAVQAFEYFRENVGSLETDLEEEPMSVKDYSGIARSFFVKYRFNITPSKMEKIYDLASRLIEENPNTAYLEFQKVLSSQELNLINDDGQTLAELINQVDNARHEFVKFYNSLHPDNSGTSNRGIEGEIVEWEVIMHKPAKTLGDLFKEDGTIRTKLRGFRATKQTGHDRNTRPDVQLKRFHTRFIDKSVFSMLKQKDIYESYDNNKMYGFLDVAQMYNLYRDALKGHNLVPIASRGEDGKLIFASVTDRARNAVKNLQAFIKTETEPFLKLADAKEGSKNYKTGQEVGKFFRNLMSMKNFSEKEKVFFDHTFQGDYNKYREHAITRYYAYQDLFGKNWLSISPEVLMKRIKIPFTPVVTSPSLPERKLIFFNSKGVKLNIMPIKDTSGQRIGRIKENVYIERDMQQKIDGILQYILDGQTMVSESVFRKEYPEHFGSSNKSLRAKTVHYYNDGAGNLYMKKHQEMHVDLPFGVTASLQDSNGETIAFFDRDSDGFVEIYDTNGERVDYLSSDDEVKIKQGTFDKYNTIHTVPGKSIGMIQFSASRQKNLAMFSAQLSYYFDDPRFQNMLMDAYENFDQGSFSPKNLGKTLLELNANPDARNEMILNLSKEFADVVPENVEMLARMKVGKHPVIDSFFREILKNKILKPMADFKMPGSHLDFRADLFGKVNQDEIIIGPNAGLIRRIMSEHKEARSLRGGQRIQSINEWLRSNKIYTMVVRHPVASSIGFGLYRIKSIDTQIGDSFIIHPTEVKERFEGDHDHDTAHLVWLDDSMYKSLLPHLQPTAGLNLSEYDRDTSNFTLTNFSGTIDVIRNMTYGETAIGEVVNVVRFSGVLNSMFGKKGYLRYSVPVDMDNPMGDRKDITIKPRPLDSIVIDTDVTKNGKPFKGKFRELLRLYTQAAVDHPKVLLLKQWKYSRAKLINMLFFNPENPSAFVDSDVMERVNDVIIGRLLRINSAIDNQRADGGKAIKFDEIFRQSRVYDNFVNNREQFLVDLHALESKEMQELARQMGQPYEPPIAKFETSSFPSDSNKPTSFQEAITVKPAQLLSQVPGGATRFFNVHYSLSQPVHKQTVINIYKPVLAEILEMGGTQKNPSTDAGQKYATEMARDLEILFEKRRAKGETGSDLSFLDRMTAKTWDYSKDFIKFREQYGDKFDKLDDMNKKAATLTYLLGVARGGKQSVRKDLRTMPPVSQIGHTTLDPEVIESYFVEYNKVLKEAETDLTYLNNIRQSKQFGLRQLRKELGCGK